MAELIFSNETDASRYALHDGEDLVSVIDYIDDGRALTMSRVYTVPTFRGKGYAAEIVARAVEELESRGDRTVVPVCWYAAEWFEKNPEHAALLR